MEGQPEACTEEIPIVTVRTRRPKTRSRRRGAFLSASLLVAALAGTLSCGGDGTTDPVPPPPPPPPVATSITVSPATVALEVGDTLRLSAEVLDQNGRSMPGAAVTWSSGDESVATVDDAGLVTAVAEGEAAVTASSGPASGSAAVSVSPAPVPPGPVGTMPDQRLEAGEAATVDASGYFRDPDGGDLSYAAASSDSSVATAAVSGSEVTVTGVGPGTATATVTATDPDGLSAEQSFGVVVSGSEEDDFESPASADDWEGANADVAVVDGALAITNRTEGLLGLAKGREMPAVSGWTIQARMGRTTPRSSPGVVSLTRHGRFTAVRLVLRTLEEDEGEGDRGRAADVVGAAAPRNYEFAVFDGGAGEWVLLANLSGDSESVAEGAGEFTEIAFGHEGGAFVAYAGETGEAERLFRVDLADARVDGVPLGEIVSDVTGLWLANQGPAGSTALHDRVRVTGTGSDAPPPDEAEIEDAPDDATRTTTVIPPVSSVTVSPAADTLAAGDTLRLAAEAYDAEGSVVAEATFSWSSSADSVATVDASGLVTARASGAATITATVDGVTGSAEIVVLHPGNSEDRAVLVTLYETTGGPNWKNSENWLTDAPLGTWYGVTTDASGRVVRLDLSGTGVALESRHGLSGPIPPELGTLTSLEELDLAFNELTGPIPSEFGDLERVEIINLFQNTLSGDIPGELASLHRLEVLILSQNELTGSIPPEFGNLTSLVRLYLNNNSLTGAIPPELGSLPRLEMLYLQFNGFTGTIPPELGSLANLKRLILYFAGLSGSIPPELGRLANLEWLYLSVNQLSGPIPPELGGLANLERLHLLGNDLTGPIPPELGNLRKLKQLELWDNALTGPIPPELGGLTELERLNVADNDLGGPIPPELGNVESLLLLDLSSNALTGSIPPQLGGLTKLKWLYLDHNDVTGSIPPELGSLTSLERLYLGGNTLTGSIPPELGSLDSVVELRLGQNDLTGSIPPELGSLVNLDVLLVQSNDLTDPIPASFLALSLTWISFRDNDGLCAPDTEAFEAWIAQIEHVSGSYCSGRPAGDASPDLPDATEITAPPLRGPKMHPIRRYGIDLHDQIDVVSPRPNGADRKGSPTGNNLW